MVEPIKVILSKNFNKIIMGIKLMESNHKQLFHPYIKNNVQAKYIGGLLCGEASYIVKYILETHLYNVKVLRRDLHYTDQTNDHCYLLINDHIIVDPTAKQFWQDERITDINCDFLQYVQYELDPFFVGKRIDLLNTLEQINNINRRVYGKSNFDNVWLWWNKGYEITHKFDMKACMEDESYLLEKDDFYKVFIQDFKQLE